MTYEYTFHVDSVHFFMEGSIYMAVYLLIHC